MAFNSYDLANTSLAKTGILTLTEMYIPLWWYSSSGIATNVTTSPNLLIKGDTNLSSSTSSSASKLHTLNANWVTNQKFAFEASFQCGGGGYTAYAQLYDFTTKSLVSGTQITTTNTSATLIRSGQFTLTSGHVYGISVWSSSTSNMVYLDKASLIAFLS